MDGFSVSEAPALRSPVVVMAFSGWSDTGTVTTDAARRLIDGFNGRRFLEVDPEEYYMFTDTRPMVHMGEDGERILSWPENEAYGAAVPAAEHDLVVVTGVEPGLRWRTFSERLAEALVATAPSLVCTLIARPAATPHTRPVRVSGSAADPALARKYGLGRSMYQGPTGVLGVLHDTLRKRGIPLISLAAGVPHYLNVEENPPATMALLNALTPVLGVQPPVGDLPELGERFARRVKEASEGDDQIMSYVRTLEEHYEDEQDEDQSEQELPSADDVLRDVEDLLRGGNDT